MFILFLTRFVFRFFFHVSVSFKFYLPFSPDCFSAFVFPIRLQFVVVVCFVFLPILTLAFFVRRQSSILLLKWNTIRRKLAFNCLLLWFHWLYFIWISVNIHETSLRFSIGVCSSSQWQYWVLVSYFFFVLSLVMSQNCSFIVYFSARYYANLGTMYRSRSRLFSPFSAIYFVRLSSPKRASKGIQATTKNPTNISHSKMICHANNKWHPLFVFNHSLQWPPSFSPS